MGSRNGEALIDAFNMLSLTLPGVAVTYYGDEIGMVNNMDISYEETVDPSGCSCGPDLYLEPNCSRDPERTPMQWSDEDNAGFTDGGVTPWLPINSNYVELNVEAQREDPSSHLAVYKALAQLRKDSIVHQVLQLEFCAFHATKANFCLFRRLVRQGLRGRGMSWPSSATMMLMRVSPMMTTPPSSTSPKTLTSPLTWRAWRRFWDRAGTLLSSPLLIATMLQGEKR